MNKSVIFILLAISLFAALLLIYGASFLSTNLIGELPVGNVLTAIGLCAGARAAIRLSTRGTALYSFSVAALLAATAWVPFSIVLAGNLELNFNGSRGDIWLFFSLFVLALVSITLFWSLAYSAYHAFQRRDDRT